MSTFALDTTQVELQEAQWRYSGKYEQLVLRTFLLLHFLERLDL